MDVLNPRVRPRPWTVAATLVVVTLLAYLPVWYCGFVNYDDPVYVIQNPNVQTGVTLAGLKWAFTTGHGGNWIPLTWLSHMIDCQLFGLRPAGHHFTSVLFHAANVALAFVLLHTLFGSVWRSALVAALFALHPLRVESVAWISERKDVLCIFFGLLSLLFYVRFVAERAAKRGNAHYALAVLFFVLSLLAKPMLVTLPFLLLLLDWWPLNRLSVEPQRKSQISRWGSLVVEKLPFFLFTAALIPVTLMVQERGEMTRTFTHWPLWARLANSGVSYVRYIWKEIWPSNLIIFYQAVPLRWWAVGASFLVLLIVTGVAVKVRKKFPMFVFGWLWFLGLLVPVIGIVKVGDQSIADRYTYFPSLGLTLIVVWGASRLQQRWARMVALLIAVGALALFTAGTVRQISYWKTSRALFEHAVAVEPMNSVAHLGLGAEDYNDGVLKSAGEHFQAALQVVPQSADAHYNMAMVLARQGRIDEAIEHYQTTLKLRPAYASAAYNCGLLLREAGRTEEAMAQFRYAVTVDPKHARARAALEEASLSQANPRKLAQSEFSAAVALMQRGQTAEALPHFREALQQQPDWPLPMNEIAWVLATDADEKVRNGPEALKLAQRACELTKFQQAEFVGTLDAAFAECANFHEAIATAEKARQLFAARGESNLAAMAEQRIALYRGGKPFRR